MYQDSGSTVRGFLTWSIRWTSLSSERRRPRITCGRAKSANGRHFTTREAREIFADYAQDALEEIGYETGRDWVTIADK